MSKPVKRSRWVPQWVHSAAVASLGGKSDHDREGPVAGAFEGATLADGPGAAVGFFAGLWMKVRRD